MNWNVKIQATVLKTINVEADTEQEATELAHELFTVQSEDGISEDYNEETLDVSMVD